jgi:hypothetical protein
VVPPARSAGYARAGEPRARPYESGTVASNQRVDLGIGGEAADLVFRELERVVDEDVELSARAALQLDVGGGNSSLG